MKISGINQQAIPQRPETNTYMWLNIVAMNTILYLPSDISLLQ